MRRRSAGLILALLVTAGLYSDDGAWNSAFTLGSGPIYAPEASGLISLKKEVLIFDGRETAAHFLFENASSRPLAVECAFPVTILIETAGPEGSFRSPPQEKGSPVYPRIRDYLTVTASGTIPDTEENNTPRYLSEGESPPFIAIAIEADEAPVPIDAILLEPRVSREPPETRLTFHYRHKITFPPQSETSVTVVYRAPLLAGDYGGGEGRYYRWDYIIGTGGTWSGPIEDFYLLLPSSWKGKPTEFPLIHSDEAVEIRYVSDYEPESGERFELTGKEESLLSSITAFEKLITNCLRAPQRVSPPRPAALGLLRNIDSSDYLPEKADLYAPEGIYPDIGFGPERAFDSLHQSAWCEGVPGDGAGSWIAWDLARPVSGLTLRNGYNRMLFSDSFFSSPFYRDHLAEKAPGRGDYFLLNNRVRQLDILREEGGTFTRLYSLALRDSRNIQSFPVLPLPAGRYRAVIKSIYPGTLWQDTCLGEITFHEGALELKRDPFFRRALEGKLFLEKFP